MIELAANAHAKVNLALAVDQPDANGMHPIASWMTPISLADRVTLREGTGTPLTITWADDAPVPSDIDWPAEKDLAVRALRALADHTGESLDARITIEKRIPAGAGLGGGSSNAATTLRLANHMFELGLSIDELQAIGKTLGSDIPFFLDENEVPRAALVTGLGDSIERLSLTETHLALIIPDFPCATGPVYKAFDTLDPVPFRATEVETMARTATVATEHLFNDLAPAAQKTEFVLGSIRSRAEQIAGTPAHITGSGSAIFIVCENEPDARVRAAAVNAELNGCAVIATHTITGA